MTASTHPGESPQYHRPIYPVPRGVKAHDVVRFMAARGTRAIVVVSGLRPVGIVTSRDLTERVPGGGVTETSMAVESAMSSPLVRINERGTVVDAFALMAQTGISHLPVVSTSGFLVSMITLADVELMRSRGVPNLLEFVRSTAVVPMVRRNPWRRLLHGIQRRLRENRIWLLLAVGLALAGAVLALAVARSWLGFQTYELKGYHPKDLSREQYLKEKEQSPESGSSPSSR
jgi:predicted transcriptional regulator